MAEGMEVIKGRLLTRQSKALFTLARLLLGDRQGALAQVDGLVYLLEALACYTLVLADSADEASNEKANGDCCDQN